MRDKNIFRLTMIALCCVSAAAGPVAPAQEVEKERPKIKNFGWSLKGGGAGDNKTAHQATKEGGAPAAHEEEVIRVDTTLVVTDFLVLDKQGRHVAGLRKTDFVVTEDNVPQEINTFGSGDDGKIGRSFVLILDYSGSLFSYIETSVEAAKILVDKLKPADRLALVTDDVELLVDFTSDKKLLKKKLETLKNSALGGRVGRSEQFSALMATLRELFDAGDTRPIIIFQTDGDELIGLKGNRAPAGHLPVRSFSLEDVLTETDKTRATIYTIIPGVQFAGVPEDDFLGPAKKDLERRREAFEKIGRTPPATRTAESYERFALMHARIMRRQQLAITGVAKYTGGWAEYLETPGQADEVYSRVLAGIGRRYVIGYSPTNQARDGKRRKVNVAVRDHPEYTILGRKTYVAPRQ